jgi:hypothetical protein
VLLLRPAKFWVTPDGEVIETDPLPDDPSAYAPTLMAQSADIVISARHVIRCFTCDVLPWDPKGPRRALPTEPQRQQEGSSIHVTVERHLCVFSCTAASRLRHATLASTPPW